MTEENQIQVLIVGAGNIGRLYGYQLYKSGAKIHFYVREHHRENLTKYPLRIHRLTSVFRWCNQSTTENFSDYTITTDTDIASGNAPNLPEQLNYVVFAVPCHCLGEGDWLKTLITFLNNKYQKNVYYTSPIPDETSMQRIVDMGIDKSQIFTGQTNACSFFAPLANQRFDPRGKEIAKKDNEDSNPNKVIIYCPTLPELYGQLTEEAKEPTDEFVSLLNEGGLRSLNIGKDTQYGLFGILATPLFVTFAMYNWDFLKAGKNLSLMTLFSASLCETALIIMKKTDNKTSIFVKLIPFIPTILFAFAFIIAHFVSAYVCSFDIEAFCNAHFNVKLGDQTDYFTNIIKSDAEKYGIDITNFRQLLEKYKSSVKKSE